MRGKNRYTMAWAFLPLAGPLFPPASASHAQSAQAIITQAGEWIRYHWLSAVGITAAATLIGAVAATVSVKAGLAGSRRERMAAERERTAAEREQMTSERAKVLSRVREDRIAGRLEASLRGAEPLALWCRRRAELVEEPSQATPGLVFRPAQFPARESILETFDQSRGSLLIAGEPGAGKTTLLLQLAEGLLERAESDTAQPLPLVIDLSDCGLPFQALSGLAVQKLTADCGVSQETALHWIAQGSVVLLLDELDKVRRFRRAICVTAINDYLHENNRAKVALCCRSVEAQALRGVPEQTWRGGQREVRLRMREAIELEPPTISETKAYLAHAADGTSSLVTDITAALAAYPDLDDFLCSPLRLSAIRYGYDAAAARRHALTASRQWPQRLWAAYITGIDKQYPLNHEKCGYDSRQATAWLAWLASKLRKRGSAQFTLTDLNERWLPAPRSKPHGIVERTLRHVAAERPLPPVSWERSWIRRLSRRKFATNITLVVSVATALSAGIFVRRNLFHESFSSRGFADVSGIVLAAFFALTLIGYTAVSGGSLSSLIPDKEPGRNIYLTPAERLYGPWHAIASGGVCGFFLALAGGLYADLAAGIALLACFEPAMAFTSALIVLAFREMRPYAMCALLARSGVAPKRYKAFLDEMTSRQLLSRTGEHYSFAHHLLGDHLADCASSASRRSVDTRPSH